MAPLTDGGHDRVDMWLQREEWYLVVNGYLSGAAMS